MNLILVIIIVVLIYIAYQLYEGNKQLLDESDRSKYMFYRHMKNNHSIPHSVEGVPVRNVPRTGYGPVGQYGGYNQQMISTPNGQTLPAATTPTALGYKSATDMFNDPAHMDKSYYEVDDMYRTNLRNMLDYQYDNDYHKFEYNVLPEPNNINNLLTMSTNYYPKQIYSQLNIASVS